MLKRSAIEIGDIFHVMTSVGVMMGQVIHMHPEFGCVITVFKYDFPKKPKDYNDVVKQPIQLITTFDLQYAVNRGLMALIANVPVPEQWQKFPVFRNQNTLWDGKKYTQLDRALTAEELALPLGPRALSPVELVRIIKANYDPHDPINDPHGFNKR